MVKGWPVGDQSIVEDTGNPSLGFCERRKRWREAEKVGEREREEKRWGGGGAFPVWGARIGYHTPEVEK